MIRDLNTLSLYKRGRVSCILFFLIMHVLEYNFEYLFLENVALCACISTSTKFKQKSEMCMNYIWFLLFLHCQTRCALFVGQNSLHVRKEYQYSYNSIIKSRYNNTVTYFAAPHLILIPELIPFPE